jgi:hypothetical protein
MILMFGTTTLVVNILAQGVLMKEKPTAVSHDLKFSIPIAESSFINLCNSYDEDDLFLS